MVANLYRSDAGKMTFAQATALGGGKAVKNFWDLPQEKMICTLVTAEEAAGSWHGNERRMPAGASYWDAIKEPYSGVRPVAKQQAAFYDALRYANAIAEVEAAQTVFDDVVNSGRGSKVSALETLVAAQKSVMDSIGTASGLFFPVDLVTGKVHGSGVSDKYAISGLPEVMELVDTVLATDEGKAAFPSGLPFNSLATFNFGAIQVLQLKYKSFDLGTKGNQNDSLLTFMVSHDGTLAISVGLTIVMVVCTNTATHAASDMTNKVKSTVNWEARVKVVLEQLLLGKQNSDNLIDLLDNLKTIKLTTDLENQIQDILFPVSKDATDRQIAQTAKVRETWRACLDEAPGQDLLLESQRLYGATTFFDNRFARVRVTQRWTDTGMSEEASSDMIRMERSMTADNTSKANILLGYFAEKLAA